jgi:hypothetical protein
VAVGEQLFDIYREAPLIQQAMEEARHLGRGNIAEHYRMNEILEIGKQLVGQKVEVRRVEELKRKGETPAIVRYTQCNEQSLGADRATGLPTLDGARYIQRDFFPYPRRIKGRIAEADAFSGFMVVKPRLPKSLFDRYWVRMIDEETGLPLVTVDFINPSTYVRVAQRDKVSQTAGDA